MIYFITVLYFIKRKRLPDKISVYFTDILLRV